MPPVPSIKKDKVKKPRVVKEPTKAQLNYIVEKFVQRDKIIWVRDMACARNLFGQYPKFVFWTILPVHFKVVTMTAFLSKGTQDFLKIEWAKFNLQLPEAEPIILEPTPQCERRTYAPAKPRSILDFCK